jgi:hypothetical protein
MRSITFAAVLSAALLSSSPASADVHLTISNGHVTLSAKDATVRQILAEWARVGQTKIVNADRIVGTQLTLELANVSEEEALDIILRSVSGYLAAPRSAAVTNASRYDRILVLPTSTGTRAVAAAPATFQQPQFNPQQRPDEDDDADDEPNGRVPPGLPNGQPTSPRGPIGPIFNAFPPVQGGRGPASPAQPAATQPAPAPAPAQPAPGVFGAPGVTLSPGVARPGMVVPPPPPQQQLPGQPGVVQETPQASVRTSSPLDDSH